jgi:hypothetical protein
VDALAAKIREFIASPERMAEASRRNLAKAQEFRQDILFARRKSFLEHLRRTTTAWLASSGGMVDLGRRAGFLECR